MQVGDWSGAIRQLSQAEQVYRAQDDIGAQCRVITQLASACCELGEYGEALDGFAQAQKLARQHNDHAAARRALVHQSNVHTMLGDFEAARESLRSALELPSGSAADEGLVVLHFGMVDRARACALRLPATPRRSRAHGGGGGALRGRAYELLAGTSRPRERNRCAHPARCDRCWRAKFKGASAT
jgi:tetratricopeptide (TPR) repeat protein